METGTPKGPNNDLKLARSRFYLYLRGMPTEERGHKNLTLLAAI